MTFELTPIQQIIGIVLYGGIDLWVTYRRMVMRREKDYEL